MLPSFPRRLGASLSSLFSLGWSSEPGVTGCCELGELGPGSTPSLSVFTCLVGAEHTSFLGGPVEPTAASTEGRQIQGHKHPAAGSCPWQAGKASQEGACSARAPQSESQASERRRGSRFLCGGEVPRAPGPQGRLREGPAELYVPCISPIPFGFPALPVTRTDRGPLRDNGAPCTDEDKRDGDVADSDNGRTECSLCLCRVLRGASKGGAIHTSHLAQGPQGGASLGRSQGGGECAPSVPRLCL